MKLFTAIQISEIDAYTVEHEPILSVNLMERAVRQVFDWFKKYLSGASAIHIFVGPGNNGGDGLALARMLLIDGWRVSVYLVNDSGSFAPDTRLNLERLQYHPRAHVVDLELGLSQLPVIDKNDVVVDAIFGTGLSRQPSGLALEVIRHINLSLAHVVAIDIPSGLKAEDNTGFDQQAVVKASETLTFQFPKLSFFMSGNEVFVGQWHVLDIGLHPKIIADTPSDFSFIRIDELKSLLKVRGRFAHKGIFGHALLCAGSYGMMGAAQLSALGCLRSGVGLLTLHVPQCGVDILQSSVPEAMVSSDVDFRFLSHPPVLERYSALGVGPGLGRDDKPALFIQQLLDGGINIPLVMDADALYIMSENKHWWSRVPHNSIITPHPGEFDRLTHNHNDGFARMESAREFARTHHIVVVLKGAHTLVATPDGSVCFNSTGNSGLATGGSGDVLTGIILSLLAQGYQPSDAALVAVAIHGLAADLALSQQSEESLLPSDVIGHLGKAFLQIRANVGLI